MDTPLNASANNAGAIFSNNMFEIPQFQREYSWTSDEVTEFWTDLKESLDSESYFLGLMILTKSPTGDDGRKQVVDGQQRIITISLLASAIYHEAIARDRKALAERIQASFLKSIDYESDEQVARVKLSDIADNVTFRSILTAADTSLSFDSTDSVSARMIASHDLLVKKLKEDLRADPFKRLGKWTDFLTNRLYFAVFVHPDSSSAYQVYEVINTRGRDLTTADLLKNYVLSQTSKAQQPAVYDQWRRISKQFANDGANNFVQYIRHVVTVRSGYILPKDLFGFLASRTPSGDRVPPRPNELMQLLEDNLPLYLQMIDPTLPGPASQDALGVFAALNDLSVLTVRPVLLACSQVDDSKEGMEYLLRLVVRRIIVGNLGTGNVERRFGEAARAIYRTGNWTAMIDGLRDLNPSRADFVSQLRKRSFNKQVLGFIRRSIVQNTITPSAHGHLHFVWIKGTDFGSMSEEEGSAWSSTIANTFLADLEKRPRLASTWHSFKQTLLPAAETGEWAQKLNHFDEWSSETVEQLSSELAEEAGRIWYGS